MPNPRDLADDGGYSNALQDHCEICVECRALDVEHRTTGYPPQHEIDAMQAACFEAEQDSRAETEVE